ncbi:MAG TPA: DUF1638 domain-containing protein [Patescibacteria group bacterium]|nr:DUF1638 domain-containing protein [Patescibacteria group bacterium]
MRNTRRQVDAAGRRAPLVIGCGALATELVELTRRAGLPAMDLACLPASLHNRPEQIPARVAARISRARRDGYDRIFVAYADCGTGGLLDRVLEDEGVARLEGAHCYEVYAGRAAFAALHEEEPGTFYLTDYLVRNFERLVVRGLGLDRHPELLPVYFGNYHRLVYLAQVDDPELTARAATAAARLGLAFERRLVGLGELASSLATFAGGEPETVDSQATNHAGRGAVQVTTTPTPRFVDSQARRMPETPPVGRERADLLPGSHDLPRKRHDPAPPRRERTGLLPGSHGSPSLPPAAAPLRSEIADLLPHGQPRRSRATPRASVAA